MSGFRPLPDWSRGFVSGGDTIPITPSRTVFPAGRGLERTARRAVPRCHRVETRYPAEVAAFLGRLIFSLFVGIIFVGLRGKM